MGGGAFSDIIMARDNVTNEPLVNSVIVGAPCEACQKLEKPWLCQHNGDSLSTSKDPERMAQLMKIYDACNVSGIIQGELLGELGIGLQVVFACDIIRDLVNPYRVAQFKRDQMERGSPIQNEVSQLMKPPRLRSIIVAIDPAGVGKGSELAMMAMGITDDIDASYVIIMAGAEHLDGTQEHMRDFAVGTIHAIRSVKEFQDVPIVAAIEAQSNDCIFYAQWLMEADTACGGWTCVMAEHSTASGMAWGVLKTHEISRLLVERTLAQLNVRHVKIWPGMLAHSTPHVPRPKTAPQLVTEIEAELKNYRYDMKTGKYSGKASGADDLMITQMMCIYHMGNFCLSEREDYVGFKNRFPLSTWRVNVPADVARQDVAKSLQQMSSAAERLKHTYI